MEETQETQEIQETTPQVPTKSEVYYVETHLTNINPVIADIALHVGVGNATAMVQKWFKDYSAFVYDKVNGNLLLYMTRYNGAMEVQRFNIEKYRR